MINPVTIRSAEEVSGGSRLVSSNGGPDKGFRGDVSSFLQQDGHDYFSHILDEVVGLVYSKHG